ncbi:NIPSNAP family protein [Mucilaginibacter sp. RS28]|uniref:NIPSNAP family protein n=1 Tax=Mucilaginibacter straminoryzae TaxID=2932774 RepID=A0A9X2B8A4_9SPHI|nr:NIPSNAP family protein [Mucilaginibacter straminoryzae]MCJ8208515.1 NIPSNAP family protein [Mucilaginibacter straminoryzae]
MRKTILIFICLFTAASAAISQDLKKSYGDYYVISIYHTKNAGQLDSLNQYLQSTYLPLLHQRGLSTVGVFTPMTNDTSADKKIVIWVPLKSLQQLHQLSPNAAAPKYYRLENIVLAAFEKAPKFKIPQLNGDPQQHIFELRSYESPTEERYISKVKMFNAGGEVPLFARLGFNAVFYAHVLAGSRMPNLMYMTSFDNQASHDEHWKAFSDDAYWKKLSAMEEYQKNVNKADIILMHPTAYSDVK